MAPQGAVVAALGVCLSGALLGGCSKTKKEPPAHTDIDPPSAMPTAEIAPMTPALPIAPVRVTLPKTSWPASKQALHVLNRLAFGPRPGEIEAVAATGVAAWIGAQLRPGSLADAAVEAKLRKLPAISMSIGQLQETYPQPKVAAAAASRAAAASAPASGSAVAVVPQAEAPSAMVHDLVSQKILRATESERQLQEVLVDFWFNHFNVVSDKGKVKWYLIPYEREAIRPHVFGRFRDLLGATARHPAMLFYLDNWQSVAEQGGDGGIPKPGRGLNENYGRELLELHTLGVDGGYTQDDVRETARAFTGWTIENPGAEAVFAFHPKQHDKGDKRVLGKVVASDGEGDGERVLDLLAGHPKTAHFLAAALCQKFHSDNPPESLVKHVTEVFTKSGGDLTRVYEAIFTAPEFWSDAAFRTKTKTPFELVASALRAVGAETTEAEPVSREIDKLGEPLYRCAPPTGYKETADAWVSTGGLLGRINFGLALGAGRIKGTVFDRDELTGNPPPEGDEALVDRLSANVLHTAPSAATRAIIVRELGHATAPIPYQEPPPSAVPLTLGLLLGSPEMQKQ
jgi:uncharacterized protein (DUF1800 family)